MSATKSDTPLLPAITLLDGGMGQELLKRSSQEITPMPPSNRVMTGKRGVSDLVALM